MHIPDDPLYYEKYYFTPGDSGFAPSIPSRGKHRHPGVLGPVVSGRSPSHRAAGRKYPVLPDGNRMASGGKSRVRIAQHDAWRTIQRAHAIANGVYVGVVNRVGFETGNIRGNVAKGEGLEFWGGSFLSDPFGRVLVQGSHDKEEILLGEVDLRHLEDIRRNWPFLRDRRIDSYAPITSRMID